MVLVELSFLTSCVAMNRFLPKVILGVFGTGSTGTGKPMEITGIVWNVYQTV